MFTRRSTSGHMWNTVAYHVRVPFSGQRGGKGDPLVGSVQLVAESPPGVCAVCDGGSIVQNERHVEFKLSNGTWAQFLADFGVANACLLKAGGEGFDSGNLIRPTGDIAEAKVKPQGAVHTGLGSRLGIVFLDGELHVSSTAHVACEHMNGWVVPVRRVENLVGDRDRHGNLQIMLFGTIPMVKSSVESWPISAMSPAANSSWVTGTSIGGSQLSRRRFSTKTWWVHEKHVRCDGILANFKLFKVFAC